MFLSGCNCVKTIEVQTPPSCPDCMQVAAYFTGCENAPECGETATIDVNADSVFNGCDCGVYWEIVDYDATVFDSVTISSAGELSFTPNSNAVSGEFYTIWFRADCQCSSQSDFGHVLFCAKDCPA